MPELVEGGSAAPYDHLHGMPVVQSCTELLHVCTTRQIKCRYDTVHKTSLLIESPRGMRPDHSTCLTTHFAGTQGATPEPGAWGGGPPYRRRLSGGAMEQLVIIRRGMCGCCAPHPAKGAGPFEPRWQHCVRQTTRKECPSIQPCMEQLHAYIG